MDGINTTERDVLAVRRGEDNSRDGKEFERVSDAFKAGWDAAVKHEEEKRNRESNRYNANPR
jgi:hypothetical protein